MSNEFGDARLEELRLLSEIERRGEHQVTPPVGPKRDLVAYLIHERFVNHLNPRHGDIRLGIVHGVPGESELEKKLHSAFLETLFSLFEGSTVKLHLSHRGRVRLSELKQSLRAGREREPFGILWDVRHWERDLQIAVLEARKEYPLGIAYLDMNGLKQINNTHGHDGGDLALRAYLQAIATVLNSSTHERQ